MAINYIDDNGVRQIFSDIKRNLDSINNTAVSAYDKANEAYSISSSGSITQDTQIFNIDGNKTFNITNGGFYIFSNKYFKEIHKTTYLDLFYNGITLNVMSNNTKSSFANFNTSTLIMADKSFLVSVYEQNYNYTASKIYINKNTLKLETSSGAYIRLSDYGIYISDGKGHSGYLNMAKCI